MGGSSENKRSRNGSYVEVMGCDTQSLMRGSGKCRVESETLFLGYVEVMGGRKIKQ